MSQQGSYTRWNNATEQKVTWTELWKANPNQIKFLVQAVYNIPPSLSNIHI